MKNRRKEGEEYAEKLITNRKRRKSKECKYENVR
jgi:hypothetical protein